METFTSIAHTAAKAVWGDGTERHEPASGVQGDVTKGEPYDGGNIEFDESNKRDSKFDTETTATVENFKQSETSKRDDVEAAETVKPAVGYDEPASAWEASRDVSKGDDVDIESRSKESIMSDGPKPLATIAKENGGDAGNLRSDSESKFSGSAEDATPQSSNDNKSGEGKGTGELYVKTSGLAADGGDFDATKPGAGREADRLMEAKGIERESSDHSKAESSSYGSGNKNDMDKPSIKERIKDKLHLHKS